MKKKMVIVLVVTILSLAVIGFFVERKISPPLQDRYFSLDASTPPNLIAIRPAHFIPPDDRGNYWQQFTNAGKVTTYLSGRGVTVQEMIAAAYGFSQSRIVFPSDMPSGQFDYVVSVPEKEKEELQAVIKSKWGYIAHEEKRDTEVLALTVELSDLPGLQISTNTVRSYRAGKLTRFNVNVLVWPLENRLQQPVVDETGLTNFYDFRWNFGARDKAAIDKQLAGLGLGLEPKTEPLDMLVVEKAD